MVATIAVILFLIFTLVTACVLCWYNEYSSKKTFIEIETLRKEKEELELLIKEHLPVGLIIY